MLESSVRGLCIEIFTGGVVCGLTESGLEIYFKAAEACSLE
jgi:hypothetical protein